MDEIAVVLNVKPEEITEWLTKMLHLRHIRPAQHSKWTLDRVPIPDEIVRLYVMQKQGRWVPPEKISKPGRGRASGHG